MLKVINNIGINSMIKGKKGNWITLSEFKNGIVSYVKSAQIDGHIIKEDTWYALYNEEFHEVIIADGIKSIVTKKLKQGYKALYLNNKEEHYLVTDGVNWSHGDTLKEAKEDLKYKLSDRDTTEYKAYNFDTEVTHKNAITMYRKITGACSIGTKYFCENNADKIKPKYTVKELIELTQGQFGNDKLVEFFEDN